MKISNIINEANNDFGIIDILNENEFDTLGLMGSHIKYKYCSFIDNFKYIDQLSDNVVTIITTRDIYENFSELFVKRTVCISDNPRISFFKIHNYLADKNYYHLRDNFKTQISENCNINKNSYIADNNVYIGNNVIIEEFSSIKANTIIGDNSIIRAGTIVGGEGFEFKRLQNDEVLGVKHIGWTIIGNNVEIQQNSCIDKAIYPWDYTGINDYCKIDNLVHIAHGVKLENGTFIVAGALIGGRTEIGKNTWVGVGATVSNGLKIGNNVRVNIGSVATRDLVDNSNVTGNFAIEHDKFIKFIKSIR